MLLCQSCRDLKEGHAMSLLPSIIAAVAAIAGSFGGAYLSFRIEAAKWRRAIHQETQTHWRDTRLSTCRDFLIAHRKYLALVFDPSACIEAHPRPDVPEELMPYFAEAGRPYREEHDAWYSAVRLVAGSERTVKAVSDVVKSARQLAADREKFSPQELPSHKFKPLWDQEQEFINACLAELELDVMARYGSRAGLGIAQQSGNASCTQSL
jgi:hypothetical protein